MDCRRHCECANPFEGFIYRWTKIADGKWYIGSHMGCPLDGYTGSGIAFKMAIRKHGIAAFNREIMYVYMGSSSTELYAIEEQVLLEYDAAGRQK